MINNTNRLRRPVQKDLYLMGPLLLLNLVSGYTTIEGAKLALGGDASVTGIAVAAGVSIQGILFILLSGSAAKHAPLRKWIAVAIFGFFSIYTSFFAYYSTFMSTDQMEGVDYNYAEVRHQELVDDVVDPFQAEFNRVSASYKTLNRAIDDEQEGSGESGISGRGPVAKELISQRDDLEPRFIELETVAIPLEELLSEARGLTSYDPNDLFEIDKAIWEILPTQYHQNYQPPQRQDYYNQDARYELLAPIISLTNSEPDAQKAPSNAALVMAATIDGVSIMLGTAIDRRARRAPFEGVTFTFVQIIWGAKKAVKTIAYYWRRKGYRYVNAADSETIMARAAVTYIELKIENKGSEFLEGFLAAVSPGDRKIDYDQLVAGPHSTINTGYRLLLEAFRHPSLEWISTTEKENEWVFTDFNSYAEFCKWLSDEIVYQAEQEGPSNGYAEYTYRSPKVVKFRRPLSA